MALALGRELGLDDTTIDAIADWEHSDRLTEVERLVLAYAEALTDTPASVDDAMRTELQRHFSKKQIVELTHSIAWENARARFNRGFDIQPDGYQ